jgi:hypothetical protein
MKGHSIRSTHDGPHVSPVRWLTAVLVAVSSANCAGDRDEKSASTASATTSPRKDPPPPLASATESAATSPTPTAHSTVKRPATRPPIDLAPVVAAMHAVPYVEQTCSPTTFAGWPYEAKACDYTQHESSMHVVVADPDPSRIASWIEDAARQIPLLETVRAEEPKRYVDALLALSEFVMGQSSRIFPLAGDIWEDMRHDGVGKRYPFDRGVSVTSGRCRLVSLTAADWCDYLAATSPNHEPVTSCKARLSDVNAFAEVCLSLHRAGWESNSNEAFRAFAHSVNGRLRSALKEQDPTSEQIVAALRSVLGLAPASRR